MTIPGRQLVRRVLGRPVWRAARCCFALSTGRTGSQTLTSLLNLSEAIRAFHHPAPQLLVESFEAFGQIREEPRRFERIFAEAKSTEIGVARVKGKLYAETSNRLTFFAPAIARLLPNSKFIYSHRHPADVVRSGMRRGWYDNHPWDPSRIVPLPHDDAFSSWPQWDSFAKCCWYWTAMNAFSLQFLQEMPQERCLTLAFDDLMDVQSENWLGVFEFLEVQAPAQDKVQEVFGRRENGQNHGEFPPLSEWDDHKKQTLLEIAGETMAKLGYSLETTAKRSSVCVN